MGEAGGGTRAVSEPRSRGAGGDREERLRAGNPAPPKRGVLATQESGCPPATPRAAPNAFVAANLCGRSRGCLHGPRIVADQGSSSNVCDAQIG